MTGIIITIRGVAPNDYLIATLERELKEIDKAIKAKVGFTLVDIRYKVDRHIKPERQA